MFDGGMFTNRAGATIYPEQRWWLSVLVFGSAVSIMMVWTGQQQGRVALWVAGTAVVGAVMFVWGGGRTSADKGESGGGRRRTGEEGEGTTAEAGEDASDSFVWRENAQLVSAADAMMRNLRQHFPAAAAKLLRQSEEEAAHAQWEEHRRRQRFQHLHKLPPEVLGVVLSFATACDLTNLAQVSRRCREAASDRAVWEQLGRMCFPVSRIRAVAESMEQQEEICPRTRFFRTLQTYPTLLCRVLSSSSGSRTTPSIVVHGEVINISQFAESHPGGEVILLDLVGSDATHSFETVAHSDMAKHHMATLCVYSPWRVVGRRGSLQCLKDADDRARQINRSGRNPAGTNDHIAAQPTTTTTAAAAATAGARTSLGVLGGVMELLQSVAMFRPMAVRTQRIEQLS